MGKKGTSRKAEPGNPGFTTIQSTLGRFIFPVTVAAKKTCLSSRQLLSHCAKNSRKHRSAPSEGGMEKWDCHPKKPILIYTRGVPSSPTIAPSQLSRYRILVHAFQESQKSSHFLWSTRAYRRLHGRHDCEKNS